MIYSWNAVEVSLKNQVVSIAVNGAVVAEVQLERENGRQFGFYHDKNTTSVQVRNVTLQGDWPTNLSEKVAPNLMALARESTRSVRRGISELIGENFFAEGAEEVVLRTRGQTSDDRFAALSKWVLPNDDHATLRLYGSFPPSHALPESNPARAVLSQGSAINATSRRQYENADAVAPVLDLIAIADELKRLDQLAKEAEPVADDEPSNLRARMALKILVHIARKQFTDAIEGLNQLKELSNSLDLNRPLTERWPEYVVG